jgi:hypothetical protein
LTGAGGGGGGVVGSAGISGSAGAFRLKAGLVSDADAGGAIGNTASAEKEPAGSGIIGEPTVRSVALQPGPEQGTGISSHVSQIAQPAEPTARTEATKKRRDRNMSGLLSKKDSFGP